MPRLLIACKVCGASFGSMEAPTSSELRKMLSGSPFAAIAGMIPPNVATELAQMPIFVCGACTINQGDTKDGNFSNADT